MESEFRKDLVSGDWVLIASGRSKRPHSPKPRADSYQSKEDCPFEHTTAPVEIIKNAFPAVAPGLCGPIMESNGYQVTAGVGMHELFIMKDHDTQLYDFSKEQMTELVGAYRNRYREISSMDNCGQYIMIFNNYGREGGASVYHPHSQIITLPIIPPSVMRSLKGSYNYFRENKQEAHALMIEKEISQKNRIVFENDNFVVFCPFVSKHPYETRIYPKFASGHFEKTDDAMLEPLAEALLTVLKKIHGSLGDPAYNFFIHTAPLHFQQERLESSSRAGEHKDYSADEYYRWHIEVIPRISFDAGFEAGTGIKINIIDPDFAAGILNGTNNHE